MTECDPPMDPGADFHLGEWLVQPSLNRLTRGEVRVQLELKAMEVLVCLAVHGDRLVSRRELVDAVWRTEFIADNTLTHAIGELRKALGDDPRAPRYIETIPKRGYRLVAEVRRAPPAPELPREAECACVVVFGGRCVPLADGEHLIGRAADAAIRVDSKRVSRYHARIAVSWGHAMLEDLCSKNGTFLGDRRVETPVELESGDRITVGPAELVFRVVGLAGSTETEGDEALPR